MRGFKIPIFGMIIVSLDLRIVNVHDLSEFVQYSRIRALCNFFGQEGHPEGAHTPMLMCLIMCLYNPL